MPIYFFQNHQGKGIERRLVQVVASRLMQLGINSMLVWVLVDNPAYQFYLSLGGQQVYAKDFMQRISSSVEKD